MRVWMSGWRDRRRDSGHGVSAPRTRLYSCWLIERSVNLNFPPTGYISRKVVCFATTMKKSRIRITSPDEPSFVFWRCAGREGLVPVWR